MSALEHDMEPSPPDDGFGPDVAWSDRMAAGSRLDLDQMDPDPQLTGVDDAAVAEAARAQVRRIVDDTGAQRGLLLFGQLRPGLAARLFDTHLRERDGTSLAAERAAGRVGDHLRLTEAPSRARPAMDPDLFPVTRWPVTVLDTTPASGSSDRQSTAGRGGLAM